MPLTSWADLSLDVFRETFRGGGACIESGCDRFLSAEGPKLELLRRGGVDGGVSNVSSEEERCSSSADSPAFHASAAWVGTAEEVLMASMRSAISWSG